MGRDLISAKSTSALLTGLVGSPEELRAVQRLPHQAFTALVRHVGVEDAGELIAAATTEQLVAAFDEDLFSNARPGEREVFDSERLIVWLEALLEAGEQVAAARFAELSEEFVVQALSSLLLVLDNDALLERMALGGDDARRADKAIESTLWEEIDGYMLIALQPRGWDAALALIVALDRDHRDLLVRLLDRCADIGTPYIDDLDELSTVLSEAESLAEDVEAAREARRGRQGFVEPQAARAFLKLARRPPSEADPGRDPITRSYLRDLGSAPAQPALPAAPPPQLAGLLRDATAPLAGPTRALLPSAAPDPEIAPDDPLAPTTQDPTPAIGAALELLQESDPDAFANRMIELVYLANVLIAGAEDDGERFRAVDAAEAALATVGLGAALTAEGASASPEALREVLRHVEADALFRRASAALAARGGPMGALGFARDHDEAQTWLDDHPTE